MKEGEIFYSIEYIRSPSSLHKELMPKEMVTAFRDDMITTELRSPFGNSGISTLYNPEEDIHYTYVSLLSFRYFYVSGNEEIQPGFSSMIIESLNETGRTTDIAGYLCREVEVGLAGSDSLRNIWYTDEICVADPNQHTPFHDINGVLMDFFYIIGETEIALRAEAVYAKEIPEKNFEKKKNYSQVSGGFLDSLVVKMISY